MIPPARLSEDQAQALLTYARACILHELGGTAAGPPLGPVFTAPGATFVTLRWPDGALQGCIGTLEARVPLAEDVAHNAVAAALHDPRARPLSREDVAALTVELSVLSPLSPVPYDGSEAGALAALRPPEDGVVLRYRGRRATFLPQMWEQLGGPGEFLRELKRKAGLPGDFWDPGIELSRYHVHKYVDRPPCQPGAGGSS